MTRKRKINKERNKGTGGEKKTHNEVPQSCGTTQEMTNSATESCQELTNRMADHCQPTTSHNPDVTPSEAQPINTESMEAETQTNRCKGTQTEPISVNTQATQTESGVTEGAEVKQGPPQEPRQDPTQDGSGPANQEAGNTLKEEDTVSCDKTKNRGKIEEREDIKFGECPESITQSKSGKEGSEPKSCAQAAGENTKEQKKEAVTAPDNKSQSDCSQRKLSPVRSPSGPPMFTFYIYAVLDKHFRFNHGNDSLLLLCGNDTVELEMTMFKGLHQDGYLIEATFSVEESTIQRGQWWEYQFAVLQGKKTIEEIAWRHIQIPEEKHIKELHLYEGHISRCRTVSMAGRVLDWFRNAEKDIAEYWRTSARILLDKLFEKWDPSSEKSTETFIQHLHHYQKSFLSASQNLVFYPEYVLAPCVKVSDLIEERLLRILNEKEGRSSKRVTFHNPLVVGITVFQVCCACRVDVGEKGWGRLCQLVSSPEALTNTHLDEMKQRFSAPQNSVIGLINHCAGKVVSELLLLVPLLQALRQPGADAGRLDPAVEEASWAGLENVQYKPFREKIRNYPEKRRILFQLIQSYKLSNKERTPVLATWLSLVAFEDMPEFVQQFEIVPEHLMQSLMYRLKDFQLAMDNNKAQRNLEITDKILDLLLKRMQTEKERARMLESGMLNSILGICVHIHKSTCKVTRLVQFYKAAVLSFQLVLRFTEMQHAALPEMESIQQEFSQWRDALLVKPLLTGQYTVSYPREIEMWDTMYRLEFSVAKVSEQWKSRVENDLKKRISQAGDVCKVVMCSLDMSENAIKKCHPNVQACFQVLCHSAIKNICEAGKEGDLMQTLQTCCSRLPSSPILSSIIVESAARFRDDPVSGLLEPQSAIHFLLSQSKWSECNLDAVASEVKQSFQSCLSSLVESLCQGSVSLSHLQTTLKHGKAFKTLFQQYKKNHKESNIAIDADELLAQRDKDLQAFNEQRAQMYSLIKMVTKVSEMIRVPEISSLMEQHQSDLRIVSLNKLIAVKPCFSKSHLEGVTTGQVLCYTATPCVLDMAREMHELEISNLVLSFWIDRATSIASTDLSMPTRLTLPQVHIQVWLPCLTAFRQQGLKIACGSVTFDELDKALEWSGDGGDGARMKQELDLMASKLENYEGLEANWPGIRLPQIQQYRQLHHAVDSANAILRIRDSLNLSGDFRHIDSLARLREESFKQRTLVSLSGDLISARQKLSHVTRQHTACLEEFLKSHTLVSWVKKNLQNLSDLKVFVDLAMISAGENDVEIDRVAGFHDAVMGYSPLLYSLPANAGFEKLLDCAQQVWHTLKRDEKLPEKLRDSAHWLDWLKGLRETHGSVEQSSLSLASAINSQGTYYVGQPVNYTGKRHLGNCLRVRVCRGTEVKSHTLEELLELHNKLMLMSSKGEHGKEQVNRFTQIFEGVQRMGGILLELHASGNMLFQDWEALVHCNTERQPCIHVSFPVLGKEITYQGEVTDQLQEVCRSMEACHNDWCTFLSEMRSMYHPLNHYTSKQVVYLCQWIHSICVLKKPVPQQIWHLLLPIKPDSTLTDIREAFAKATELARPQTEHSASVTQEPDWSFEENSGEEDVEPWLEDEMSEIESQSSQQCSEEPMESVTDVWACFKADMSKCLTQCVDIGTLARFLSCLSDMNGCFVRRTLPPTLQEGKPNLVLCQNAEVLSTALSVYMESPAETLPSNDEVLICQEETTGEEVEIFLRRCLGRGAPENQRKIYTLVNPDLLAYDVSVALGECFEALERSTGSNYHLVIICPLSHQHRYVPSFFSNQKVQAGLCLSSESARKYLRQHFSAPAWLSGLSDVYPDQLSVWVVASERPAVGKSLYIERLFEKFQREFQTAVYVRIRIIEPRVDTDALVKTLSERLRKCRDQDAVVLHIDSTAVQFGLEEFLFKILVLGCLSDSEGKLWTRNIAHLIAVETLQKGSTHHVQSHEKEVKQGLLQSLPTILCRPPVEVKRLEISLRNERVRFLDPLMDRQDFQSEGIQRPYQYLKRYNRNEDLDRFKYRAGSVEGDPVDCLHHLLSNCGLSDPSWAELKHFTWFLNLQLKDCENTMFCDADFLADHLSGFKGFIVKFMMLMARDFASPSMDISDQSPSLLPKFDHEDDWLSHLTIRKRWENESHPYIFFNADHISMSFLGFHVKKSAGGSLNAIDPQSDKVLMGNVMSTELFEGLERQSISLSEDFDSLPREKKIQRISFVVGAKKGWEKGRFDPDSTYELTTDNVMKMLAIHMRFRCEIPVIIMGETGCGKTRLVRFLCDLQREGKNVENMKLVKVHGGTTADTIYRKVREAEMLAEDNRRSHNLDTVLFFDEANTTEAIFAIKEVVCDKTVQGFPLRPNSGLKIIAACNPYRKHTPEMVERLESAGLGYRVRAGETEDRLGKVPLRQLVYRVHPLPPSMMALVWDFGQLSDAAELSYIRQIVQSRISKYNLPQKCHDMLSNVLAASQRYMRSRGNECSFVSLRDVERSMKVLMWFYCHHKLLFPNYHEFDNVHMTLKCLALAVGVCYYPSLVSKEPYLKFISRYFPKPLNSQESLENEIFSCHDFFLKNIRTRETIAKNLALKENVFLMIICIELRIPLFLVGKPGSSKSLAKTVVADAMQRQAAHCDLFRNLKEVHMVSFQCSPHSSPEGIIGTFRNCSRFQKDKNMDEYVSVVVLDEIGLAEDSPQMPLKTLHPLLEDGCVDNEMPDPHMQVGFVGISNWALDPAKMNRGIFVSRWDPSEKELVETANGICSSSKCTLNKIKHLLPRLAEGFLNICEAVKNQFFGLRDYYSLVKMIFAIVQDTEQEPSDKELAEAILRNFSGQREDFDPLDYFQGLFQNPRNILRSTTLEMVEQNLNNRSKMDSRYLLLLTTNNAALHIIQQHIFAKGSYACPEIVFGSGFPKDQEYAQICRNVSRVKSCMETGRMVILLNLQNLYESLYDALNQYYVFFSGQQYVDLGLGSHRVKCRVHKNFRLIVVEDQEKVYTQFPVPLINRLEKHQVNRSTDLTTWQHRVLVKLKEWVQKFSQQSGSASADFGSYDVFVGFHGDACASALLQALEERKQQRKVFESHKMSDVKKNVSSDEVHDPMEMDVNHENMATSGKSAETDNEEEDIFDLAKSSLLSCATPDSVLRLKYSDFGNLERDELQKVYFHQQHHCSLRDFLDNHLNKNKDSVRFVEVTTFSSLLTKADIRVLAEALGMPVDQLLLLSLHQFDTEASFCSKIRSFVKDAGLTLRILLVQMDVEESRCSNELIASAKYSTMNELISSGEDERNCFIVFISKLSRIAGGSQYIGFQGGVWLSVHIDDLRDSEDMSLDLSVLCGSPISKLLSQMMHTGMQKEDTEPSFPACQREDLARPVHSLCLVRSCVQKVVALLRDSETMASRSMERMHILFCLLGDSPRLSGARFQEVLLRRLMVALAQREEWMVSPEDWVNKEAKKRQALQEGGTLRNTLWRCLQSTLTPIFAQILEVLDRDGNLTLLCSAGLSEGLQGFWLDIFNDDQLLDLTMTLNTSVSEHDINVQHHLLLGGQVCSSAAPFSWLIKAFYQSLLEESEFVPGIQQTSTERIQQFVSVVSSSRLSSYIGKLSEREQVELGQRYLRDFVLLLFKLQSEKEQKLFTRAVLGCVSELQQSVNVTLDLSPAWILAAVRHYAARLDTLSHILQLHPHLTTILLRQDTQSELPEMQEDILALGICVEEAKLHSVTSLHECQSLLRRVELLQPCLDRALNQNYSALCSPGCLKQLETIRGIWNGMLVVAVFIEQVVTKVEPGDKKSEALSLKYCNLIQKLMLESPDLGSREDLQQLIRILSSYHDESISRELRFGVKCAVCLLEMSEPCALPCEHAFCQECLQNCLRQDGAHYCPKCRTQLPPDFQPSVSPIIKSALQQHGERRSSCNSFFLEVVSRFCLTEGKNPQGEVVELLFSLVISAQGEVYMTRELSPFRECVDKSPVVRSVLPKLLLQHSFKQMKGHIQSYLQNLQENILDKEDRTELYSLFVNCFQDSLLCRHGQQTTEIGGSHERRGSQRYLQEDCLFLSRFARGQTVPVREDPAEFLLCIARLRVCLATAASLLHKAVTQPQGHIGGCEELEDRYLEQVKAVLQYCQNDWYRVYLLRAINRQAGMDFVLALSNNAHYEWVFPPEVLRLQRLIPAEVDRFLCCGQLYRAYRDGVGQLLLESKPQALREAMQKSQRSDAALLPLALFRQVTCRYAASDPKMHPEPQEKKALENFLKENMSGDLRDLCIALLSNRIGGMGSPLQAQAGASDRRRTLLELLVHAGAVLCSENVTLAQLSLIARQPHRMAVAFLPTMPDDNTNNVRQWMREQQGKMYFCSNGHACFIGECGKPMVTSKCVECGVPIGGQNHQPVSGFREARGNIVDRTQTGHILGEASRRTEAQNRECSLAQSCILRLCTHLAMLQGAIRDQQGISAMIQPPVQNVYEFLWQHLEKDLDTLEKTLGLNVDDAAIIIHLVLSDSLQFTAARGGQQRAELASRQGREHWERLICDSLINPVVKNLKKRLAKAQDMIGMDNQLAGSPLLKVLKWDPRPMIPMPSDCPTHDSSFWNIPSTLTVEQLCQDMDQSQIGSSAPLLFLFLQKVQCVRHLCHLPQLAALQTDLLRVMPSDTDTTTQPISALLQQIPAGPQKNILLGRVRTLMEVWNHLRMEMANSPDLGADRALCTKELTMESSGQYLSLSRVGPGSCLRTLINFLSETHNSLVREGRKLSHQKDSDYSVPVGALTESQLALCHPVRELLPLVLANCHYTLRKGQDTVSSYDWLAIQKQLCRRFVAGKPLIKADTEKYIKQKLQDFSAVISEVWKKIPQEPLKGSECSSIRTMLRSFTDLCDTVRWVEIALRFLGKTGEDPAVPLLDYLRQSLRLELSDNVAKALVHCKLAHCTSTWQLLTCWKSELMLRRGQDPFPRLKDFNVPLSVEERTGLKSFLAVTDIDLFTLELHEILLLKTNSTKQDGCAPQWDIRSTLENSLEQKGIPALPELDCLPEEFTMEKAVDVWRLSIEMSVKQKMSVSSRDMLHM